MKTYWVRIDRTEEEDSVELLDGGVRSGIDQLHLELQSAFDNGQMAGTFQIQTHGQTNNPVGELVASDEAASCQLLPPDQLKAFFDELRTTAQDSLTLFRILGVPSNAQVVKVWRKFAIYESSDEALDKAIEQKIAKLEALDELLREVAGALGAAQSVERDLDDAIEKAEKAVQDARR